MCNRLLSERLGYDATPRWQMLAPVYVCVSYGAKPWDTTLYAQAHANSPNTQ